MITRITSIFRLAMPVALLFAGTLLSLSSQSQSGVGINPAGNPAHSSAGLDVDFNNKGLLIPRVALVSSFDVSTISSPATSLLVYNTATSGDVTPGFYFFSGSTWQRIQTGAGGGGGGSDWTTSGSYTWLTNTGASVGIGTSSPSSSYDLTLGGGLGGGFLVKGSSTTSRFEGKVGIGFSTSTSYYLDVDGPVRFQDYAGIGITPSSSNSLSVGTGGLSVGTTSSAPSSGILTNGNVSVGGGLCVNCTSYSSGRMQSSTANITGSNGLSISATATSGTTLVLASGTVRTLSSSIRYKEDIRDLAFDRQKVLDIRPVTFKYKEGSYSVGVIAEEVEKLIPELVIYDRVPVTDENGEQLFDENGDRMFKDEWRPESVNYSGISVALLPIVRDHEQTIANQQIEIAELKARLDRQEALLTKLVSTSPELLKQLTEGAGRAESVKP